MSLSFKKLFKLSRPRFRLYLFGPLLIGWIAWFDYTVDWFFAIRNLIGETYVDGWLLTLLIVTWLYFLFPANLFVYGINDLSDRDTDLLNKKKEWFETRSELSDFPVILWWSLLWSLIYGATVVFLSAQTWSISWEQIALLFLWFLFFSTFYSLPPIRAKWIPFVDWLFNILYLFPSAFWRILSGNQLSDYSMYALIWWVLFMAAWHAYSAIPDIEADSDVWVHTTAVFLWYNNTLVYCFILWTISFWLLFTHLWRWIIPGATFFCGICLFAFTRDIFSLYKLIPKAVVVLGTFYFRVLLLT